MAMRPEGCEISTLCSNHQFFIKGRLVFEQMHTLLATQPFGAGAANPRTRLLLYLSPSPSGSLPLILTSRRQSQFHRLIPHVHIDLMRLVNLPRPLLRQVRLGHRGGRAPQPAAMARRRVADSAADGW